MPNKVFVAVPLLLLLASEVSSNPVPRKYPQNNAMRYFFCSVGDKNAGNETRMYFSKVFSADPGQNGVLPAHYLRFVQVNVDAYVYGNSGCEVFGDASAATSTKNQREMDLKKRNVSIVETGWDGVALWSALTQWWYTERFML